MARALPAKEDRIKRSERGPPPPVADHSLRDGLARTALSDAPLAKNPHRRRHGRTYGPSAHSSDAVGYDRFRTQLRQHASVQPASQGLRVEVPPDKHEAAFSFFLLMPRAVPVDQAPLVALTGVVRDSLQARSRISALCTVRPLGPRSPVRFAHAVSLFVTLAETDSSFLGGRRRRADFSFAASARDRQRHG